MAIHPLESRDPIDIFLDKLLESSYGAQQNRFLGNFEHNGLYYEINSAISSIDNKKMVDYAASAFARIVGTGPAPKKAFEIDAGPPAPRDVLVIQTAGRTRDVGARGALPLARGLMGNFSYQGVTYSVYHPISPSHLTAIAERIAASFKEILGDKPLNEGSVTKMNIGEPTAPYVIVIPTDPLGNREQDALDLFRGDNKPVKRDPYQDKVNNLKKDPKFKPYVILALQRIPFLSWKGVYDATLEAEDRDFVASQKPPSNPLSNLLLG